jgi:uncharacterized beta-barrel protein YwiB (DUF1934 family)
MPVKITVSTTIQSGEEKETYELITFGQYIQKTNSFFLRYEEIMEEGNVKTVVKVSNQEGSILRNGAVNMKLSFRKNKSLKGNYETPYGLLDIHTNTSRINHSFDDRSKKGEIDILYDLKMQGSHAGTYHMAITFEEDKT